MYICNELSEAMHIQDHTHKYAVFRDLVPYEIFLQSTLLAQT